MQVSPHTRRTIEEHDAARRMMFAAREDASMPKDYGGALLALHDRKPFPNSPSEIAELAAEVKDVNFRIETAEDGIHVYNRDGHHVAQDAMSLFAKLGVDNDGPHAFYLGTELMKAEIAWRLGKRYAQDSPLDWGCAVDRSPATTSRAWPSRAHAARRQEPPRDDLMPMIRETIVSTMDGAGRVHFAPLGHHRGRRRLDHCAIPPVDDVRQSRVVPFAVANFTDDVRVFAGCLTGRRDWPTAACEGIAVPRLADALAHAELAVTHTTRG